MDKKITQLEQLSLDGAAGVTALANILVDKGIIPFEDYIRIKDEAKEALIKEFKK